MMQKIIFLFLFTSQLILSQEAENLVQPEQIKVKSTIEGFFKAFHEKDTTQLKKFCHPELSLQSVLEFNGVVELKNETVSNFFKSIASIHHSIIFEEKIHDFQIHVDGSMAHVWTPYTFYVQKKASHSGVNSFQLIRLENEWKILRILDTRRN